MPQPIKQPKAVKQVTLWLTPETLERIDQILGAQAQNVIGAKATRHSFVVAAVRRAVEAAEREQRATEAVRS